MNEDECGVAGHERVSRDHSLVSREVRSPRLLFRFQRGGVLIVRVRIIVCATSSVSFVSVGCNSEGVGMKMASGERESGVAVLYGSSMISGVGDPCDVPGFECGPELSCIISGPDIGNACGPFGSVGLREECSPSDLCMWGATCSGDGSDPDGACIEHPLWGSDMNYPWHCREFGARVPAVNYPTACRSRCDPFVTFDCEGSCVLEENGMFGEGFHCSFRPARSLAESCEYTNDLCDTGLVCASAEELGDFCEVRDLGCCTRVCDLSLPDPDAACLGLGEADTCVPIFDDPVDEWEARLGKCVAVP